MKAFRVDSKGFFLTYSQCELSKEHVFKSLKFKRPGLEQIIVSRELHANGEPHLHCYLYYGTRFDCRNQAFFDIDGYHPNVQSAKSLKAVQAYIKKDGDFVQEGIDYAASLKARETHTRLLCKRILDGENPAVVIREADPSWLLKAPLIEKALEVMKRWEAPTQPSCVGFIPNSFGLNLPLYTAKKRHYWFWSEQPNKGKTTFLKGLQAQFPCLWYSWVEKYQTPSPNVQFVLLDEYSVGHLTVTQLNMMCDGTYQYPVKGSPSFSIPTAVVLVCGNRSPMEIYDAKHHELIKARFEIHCLDI